MVIPLISGNNINRRINHDINHGINRGKRGENAGCARLTGAS